ncbi:MAG: cell division protein FtsL [Desulfuromonadales bacterium]|nr:cell division protein FtsL [Desulfuromonadales bacterium]MDW7756382.1 cell division protein FtsL [Desulfuromonadales bacterium]
MSELILRAFPRFGGVALRKPSLMPVMAFIGLMLAISLFFVWTRIQVINLEYQISSQQERLRDMHQENKNLRLEAASLRNPARIEKVAVSELGLRFPAPQQVITVR